MYALEIKYTLYVITFNWTLNIIFLFGWFVCLCLCVKNVHAIELGSFVHVDANMIKGYIVGHISIIV